MNIRDKIENWIREVLNKSDLNANFNFTVERSDSFRHGDYSTNLALTSFREVAKLHSDKETKLSTAEITISMGKEKTWTSPKKFAEYLTGALSDKKPTEIEKVETADPGFINFFLSKRFFMDEINKINKNRDRYGKTDLFKNKKIIIEHTQPNPFKEFHIGHLMNNTIGESITRIIKSNGANTIAVSYHGDVGLHVAKTIYGLRKMEQAQRILSLSIVEKFDNIDIHSLGYAYVIGAEEFNKDEKSKREILEINKIIDGKTKDNTQSQWVLRWYKIGKDVSLKYFETIYKKLNSHFVFHFYESEAGEIGKKIVLENTPKIFEKSESASIFRGENFQPKTHTRVFINSENIPTYEAKEVGLAELKKERYPNYDKSITVTANEQDSFFDVVEVAIGEVFPELKNKLLHLSHGMLKLTSGKMSSRAGNVITAEFLIDQVKEKIYEKLEGREYLPDEKEKIAEAVAIGAIKYSILRQAIGGDIIFDFEKSISFEGDSGPYLQYTAVRAKSVLEKACPAKKIFSKKSSGLLALLGQTFFSKTFLLGRPTRPENFEITELERYLYRFPEVVERAGKEYAPHYIVTYLTELAAIFNGFYAKEKIIDVGDPASPYKIALTSATYIVLKNGLCLLGIKVPEKM